MKWFSMLSVDLVLDPRKLTIRPFRGPFLAQDSVPVPWVFNTWWLGLIDTMSRPQLNLRRACSVRCAAAVVHSGGPYTRFRKCGEGSLRILGSWALLKSSARCPKIDPPGAHEMVFDVKCRSCSRAPEIDYTAISWPVPGPGQCACLCPGFLIHGGWAL